MNPERLRDIAYGCFVAVGGCVLIFLAADLAGDAGFLPQPVQAFLLVFVMLPLTGFGLMFGLTGIVLTGFVRSDLRLYALSIITVALFVFWVRHTALGVSPRLAVLYLPLAFPLLLRWAIEKRLRSGREKH